MSILLKATTALNLGLPSLFRFFSYKIAVKTGLNPTLKLTACMPTGKFLNSIENDLYEKNNDNNIIKAFGYLDYKVKEESPNWFYSPLTNKTMQSTQLPWYKIPDFDADIGDIKGIWEASRFDWLLQFVSQSQSQNQQSLLLANHWLNDWCQHNSAYIGPNWKCGQEASIRVMHLITALIGLDDLDEPTSQIITLLEIHLARIAPTIEYAIAQNNNHGTSEATALFIGGSLLNAHYPHKKYDRWAKLGRKWLENRAKKLIMADGGFSQYSVNYHRVMLDSYSLAEIVRQKLNLPAFSKALYTKLKKATEWLYVVVQDNGDAPNLGANDGARLIAVTETDYRDFRPTLQLASTLFSEQSYYKPSGTYDNALTFFKIEKRINETDLSSQLPIKNQFFNKSGLITAKTDKFFVAFRLPIFQFRPSQCDALHLDVWWNGQNLLRDGGTYSYNSTTEDLEYFSGVASHNTVQFDEHQQMPRLSRFLFAHWLKPVQLNYQTYKFRCAYRDYWQCLHTREIIVSDEKIIVKDSVDGFKNQATLRWRLMPDNWTLENHILTNGKIEISIEASATMQIALIEGMESRYYYQKSVIPVLEVKVNQPTNFITTIQDIT